MPLNEGQTVQYTVTTTNTADGTVLYWRTTGNTTNSDIVGGNTGSITITNNRAYINVTMSSDESPDGSKTLGIALLTGSLNGTTVAATNPDAPIAVNDTSNTAPPPTTFTLYTWGSNFTGDNTNILRSSPVQIGGLATWTLASAINVKSNGTLWSWGRNNRGQLGLNNATYIASSPTQVGSSTDWYPASGQESLAQNDEATLYVKNNGTLWSIGRNWGGVLGLNDSDYYKDRSSPTQVGTGTNWSKVSIGNNFSTRAAAAIKTDGTLWTWGRNNYGQLGINNKVEVSSPIQVGSNSNWSQVFSGGCGMTAIKTDGTLWAWGLGFTGGTAQNDGVYRSSPTQVGALTTWTSLGGTGQGMAGISNGRLYYWGGWFQLVNGAYSYKSSPTQIGSDTDWLKMSVGNPFTLLKTNGTLWSAGRNENGGLGLNNTTAYTSPKQIGTKNTWVGIGAGAAISSE